MLKKFAVKGIGPIILIGICLVFVGQSLGATANLSGLDVQVVVEQDTIAFELQHPVHGKYPEGQVARFSLSANQSVTLTLQGSELTYQGNGNSWVDPYQLNVVYWIREEKQQHQHQPQHQPQTKKKKFYPNQPLDVDVKFSNGEEKIFIIGGEIRVDQVTDQPAGRYAGTIYITVSEDGL